MTQWEYAMMLLPYDTNMTEEELDEMPMGALSVWIERTKSKREEVQKESRKMTQWEYAMMLLPYDTDMTEDELDEMPRQALSIWIERTKPKRKDALKEENAELARQYQELITEQKDKLYKVADSMTTLTKKGLNEWEGPCPLCNKGHNRFIVNTRGVPFWNCRHCAEGGDTVALVAKKNGLTMWEAAEELAGWSPRDRAEVNRQRKYTIVQQSNKPKELTDLTTKLGTCRQTFSENSLAAMAYFGKRELGEQTVLKNRVGMIQTVRGMAIAYPCERLVDGCWQVVGINRRYLDTERIKGMVEKAKTEEEKKKIKRDNPKTKLGFGGKWGVYRLRRTRGAKALLVIEGEENSLSAWQAARANNWPCDVASVGCQSNFKSLRDDITALASDYQHLLIWADEQHIADEALGFYGHTSALAVSSPTLAGYGKPADANAMLMQGELSEFLAHQLNRLSATTPTNGQVPTHLSTSLLVKVGDSSESAYALPTDLPTDSDLAGQLGQDVLTSERTYWDAPDAPDAPDAHTLPTNAPTTHAPHTNGTQPVRSDTQSMPTTRPVNAHTLPTDAQPTHTTHTTHTADNAASDELLALCASLCSQVADRQKARRWYLVAEKHYMAGDATSLWECYQAIRDVMGYFVTPNFPGLPPVSSSAPSEFDQPDAYHEWVWAARAVKLGDTTHLGQAWEWARKIEDEELRGEALREMRGMTGESVGKQLTLLEAAS